MVKTIDLLHLPPVAKVSDQTELDALLKALEETMANYHAAMHTVTRDGQPLTDLAGTYLTRAGGIQLLISKKKIGK